MTLVNPGGGQLGATQGNWDVAGDWVIHASTKARRKEVTWFRDVPTDPSEWDWEDPFGPKSMTLKFGAITVFDRLGEGDLDWCCKDANVTLLFNGTLPPSYPYSLYQWEGYMDSFSYSNDGLTVECKGAMYQLDNYQAKPEYLSRPLPYEYAIARQFDSQDKPDLRMPPPIITYPAFAPDFSQSPKTPAYLIPAGVHPGKKWSGLVTRSSGTWEATLTSYIQSLLSSMYTAYGRWTLDLQPHRQPVLFHRNFTLAVNGGQTIIVDPATPGITFDIAQDYSQTMNRVFGQTKSAEGLEYSGQEVYDDPTFITRTRYEPLAEMRQVHNGYGKASHWRDTTVMVREAMLQMQDGLDSDQARDAGAAHLARFTDPGLVGTITIESDPTFVTGVSNATGYPVVTSSVKMSRYLIRPGMTVLLPGLLGNPAGVLLHISAVKNSSGGRVELSVDSKCRDAMTVTEVKKRGRDSMSVQRQIIGGQYAPPVNDQLVPWNYHGGSGFIPSAPKQSSLHLFKGMPSSVVFPWTEWTTRRPPSSKAWTNNYIHIGPKSSNADNNWAGYPTFNVSGGTNYGLYAFPIKASQAGTIRLIEIAAYDKHGNVMKVPFHVSFYLNRGVNYKAMPQIVGGVSTGTDGYASGQHYPFFNQAWEQYNVDGTQISTETPAAVSSSGLLRAYGTRFAPAGYWPGSRAAGDKPTGLLVDEGQWTFDTGSIQDSSVLQPTKKNQGKWAGYMYCMIYCDAQHKQDVYFLGRMYRQEPGQ